MKKLFIFILIICALIFFSNKEMNTARLNQKIDIYVPESIQEQVSVGWSYIASWYDIIASKADVHRASLKQWSLQESQDLVSQATGSPFVASEKSFSPILDNSSVVFSDKTTILQKLYAIFLFMVSLLFWNFAIFGIWVLLILHITLKKLKRKYLPKKRKTFFDRINEKIHEDDYEEYEEEEDRE